MASLYTIKQRRNIVLAITIALGLFLGYALKDIFTAILGTVILYTLFRPLNVYLSETKKWNRPLSSLIIILISFLILVLPFFTLTWMVIQKIIEYKNNPEPITLLLDQINAFIGTKLDKPELIQTALENVEKWALGSFTTMVSGIMSTLLQIAIMYFILFYMFVYYKEMESAMIKYFPFQKDNTMLLANELKMVTYSNVLGQGLSAFSQGALLGVGFFIFGIPSPVFWAVISIFLSFLPVIGAQLIFIPAGIISIITGNTFQGMGVLIWGFVLVTNIDNVIRFVVSKKVADIHPLITIIGVVIGIPIFGIIGLVIGPLLLSYFILLVKMCEVKINSKDSSEESKVNS